jgi:hypothetical protein
MTGAPCSALRTLDNDTTMPCPNVVQVIVTTVPLRTVYPTTMVHGTCTGCALMQVTTLATPGRRTSSYHPANDPGAYGWWGR